MNEQNGKSILERCDYLIINYLNYNIMKIKKTFGLLAAVAVVAAAGWSYQQSKQYDGMSELALANVEALATGEDGEPGITCDSRPGVCWVKGGEICFIGEGTYQKCVFAGYSWMHCTSPCN